MGGGIYLKVGQMRQKDFLTLTFLFFVLTTELVSFDFNNWNQSYGVS